MDGSRPRTPRGTGAAPLNAPHRTGSTSRGNSSLLNSQLSDVSTSASPEENALSRALLQSTENGDSLSSSPAVRSLRATETTVVGALQARRHRRRNVGGGELQLSRRYHADAAAIGTGPERRPSHRVPTTRSPPEVGFSAPLPQSGNGDSEVGSSSTTESVLSPDSGGALASSSGTPSDRSRTPTDSLPLGSAGRHRSAPRRQSEFEARSPLSAPLLQSVSAEQSYSPSTLPAPYRSPDAPLRQPTLLDLARQVSAAGRVPAVPTAAGTTVSSAKSESLGAYHHTVPPTLSPQLATPPDRHPSIPSPTRLHTSSSPTLATVAHERRNSGEAEGGRRSSCGAPPVPHRAPSSLSSVPTAGSMVPMPADLSANSARAVRGRGRRGSRGSSTDSVAPRSADGSESRLSETNLFADPAAAPVDTVDRVWPFTEPLELRAIASHVLKRIEWNLMVRQVILTLPLLVLASFYAVYNSPYTSYDVAHTESLRQLFERPTFPATATDVETYRQNHVLDLSSANLGANRHFREIQTQTHWIQFFADVVLLRAFPGCGNIIGDAFDLANLCRRDVSVDGSSFDERDEWGFVGGDGFWVPEENAGSQAEVSGVGSAAKVGSTALGGGGGASSRQGSGGGSQRCDLRVRLLYDEPQPGPSEHIFLGAMRARTIRMRSNTANLQTRMYPPANVAFPRDGWARFALRANEETAPSRCPSITVLNSTTGAAEPLYVYHAPEASDPYCVGSRGFITNYHCGGYSFELPFRATPLYAAQFRAAIRNTSCFFLDNWATRFAVVEFFTYTPSTDSFHQVKYRTEVAAGGDYVNAAVYRAFPVWTPARTGELVYMCVTAAYILFFLGTLVVRLYEKGRYGAGVVAVLVDWSAWLDLGAFTSLTVSFAYYFMWVALSVRIAPQLAVPLQSDAYPAFLDSVARLYDRRNTAAAMGVLLCFNRLCTLRALLRPMDTFLIAMERSTGTVVAITATYGAVAIAYALVAWAAFGPFSDSYRTFGASLLTCLTFWTSAGFVVPESENISFQFISVFFWSLTLVLGVVAVALLLATITHSFAQVQKEQGVTYNEAWLMSRLAHIRRAMTWPRIRRFVAKVFCLFPENEYLRGLLVRMEAVYGAAPLGHLAAGRAERRSSVPSWWDTSVTTMPTTGTAATTERGWESGNDPGTVGTAASASSRRGSDLRSASTPGWRPHFPAAPLPTFENTSQRGLDWTASSVDGAAPRQRQSVTPLSSFQQENGRRVSIGGDSGSTTPSSSRRGGSVSLSSMQSRWSDYEELRRRYEELREVAATALQSGPRVDFFEWSSIIPHDVLVKCGGMAFFADWWIEMAEAQAEIAQTPEEQGRRALREEASIATQREVAFGVVSISQLDTTLSHLEAHVDKLLHNVSRR